MMLGQLPFRLLANPRFDGMHDGSLPQAGFGLAKAEITSWNGYLLPLLILTDPDSWTIPLGLSRFAGSYTYDTARVLAYSVVAMVPTVLAYGFAERYIVQGLTAGAVKG